MRRLWPRSLAGQLTLVLVLAALLAQLASFLIFADERRLAIEGFRREEVLGRVATAVELIEATPETLHARIVRAASTAQTRLWLSPSADIEPSEGRFAKRLRGRLERLLASEDRAILIQHTGMPRRVWRPWLERDDERGEAGQVRQQPPARQGQPRDGGPRPQLAIAVQLADGTWLNARTELILPTLGPAVSATLSTFGTAALIVAVALFMVRRITRPLRALAEAADGFGRGEAAPPLAVAGPVEISRTTEAFNRMRDRLHRFVLDRTRLLAAIGHDLRTPITSLRLRAEFVGDEESRLKILETLDEMQRMVEATLAFTREEASSEPTRIVDLGALVESVCGDLVDLGREVSVEAPMRVALPCRPSGLKRAVRNLVENALAYGQRARVSLALDAGRSVRVLVEDDGPGIPEADLQRVFEPFTRLEGSRNKATGGIGLGLAIARTIARAHGGDVVLHNRPGGGLTAQLALPLPAGGGSSRALIVEPA